MALLQNEHVLSHIRPVEPYSDHSPAHSVKTALHLNSATANQLPVVASKTVSETSETFRQYAMACSSLRMQTSNFMLLLREVSCGIRCSCTKSVTIVHGVRHIDTRIRLDARRASVWELTGNVKKQHFRVTEEFAANSVENSVWALIGRLAGKILLRNGSIWHQQ